VAIEERYRFYSFGDAMLLIGGGRNLWIPRSP
jgi:S-adenosylmethionine:tRNA-ribosyltransferase-isomerase (queuine synthetase)